MRERYDARHDTHHSRYTTLRSPRKSPRPVRHAKAPSPPYPSTGSNDPTVAEARVIRDLIIKDIAKGKTMQVNLSGLENGDAIYAFLNPKSAFEEFNMEELPMH